MKNYRFKVMPKVQGNEVNIARLLQPIDLSSAKVELEESKPLIEEKKVEGPMKSSVQISSRKILKEEKISEFVLRAQKGEKTKTWLGKSEESGKYAILINDGTEVKIFLADHWYKFSPIFHNVKMEPEKPIDIGPGKRQKEEDERDREVFGEDSEEEKPKKRQKVHRRNREDDESGKEGIDFDDDFTDDEENEDNEAKEKSEEAAIKQNLSNSGREIQKFLLNETSNSGDESSDSSDLGIEDEESDREGINKQGVVNELLRLGKCKLGEFISECKKKFKSETNLVSALTGILREVADMIGTGENCEVVLKDEYKKSMPTFGVRIHFQTKPK